MNEAFATQIRYVVLVHLTALPAWLALPPAERAAIRDDRLGSITAAHQSINTRWIDVEAFAAASSDVMLAEFSDPAEWNAMFEALRDTPLFAVPYFRVDQILFGIEDGYRSVEGARSA